MTWGRPTGWRVTRQPLPARWTLWALPRRAWVYVLLVDMLAVVAAVGSSLPTLPTNDHWVTCAVLTAGAMIHLHLSHAIERIRRDHNHSPHVDLCSIWIFAGALLLPALPEVLLIVGIYGHRWWLVGRLDVGRPPHRTVFTVAVMILSSLAVTGLVGATGLREALAQQELRWYEGVALVGAIAVQWLANTALVAMVLVLTARPRQDRNPVGSWPDNQLEVSQLVLGMFVALSIALWPGLAFLMIVPAVALHRTVLVHQLELAARTDHKTGLLNASAWHHAATVELARVREEGDCSLGLFMIDLDLFSEVNNRYGHLAGDAVLRQFADLLVTSVRRGDSVGRFGGEEFAVLLPGVDQREALAVAERIRDRMHELRVTDRAGGIIAGLSVSIGVAIYPQVAEDSVEGLLAAADAALYSAKHNGRDRVQVAGDHRVLPWSPTSRRFSESISQDREGPFGDMSTPIVKPVSSSERDHALKRAVDIARPRRDRFTPGQQCQ